SVDLRPPQAELAHKSSDGAAARDGFVTVSGSDFGVFRPFPRERPSAKSLSLGETRLTGGAVALGSWRFESSRPSSAVRIPNRPTSIPHHRPRCRIGSGPRQAPRRLLRPDWQPPLYPPAQVLSAIGER